MLIRSQRDDTDRPMQIGGQVTKEPKALLVSPEDFINRKRCMKEGTSSIGSKINNTVHYNILLQYTQLDCVSQ